MIVLTLKPLVDKFPPPHFDENYALRNLNVKARAVNEGGDSAAVSNLVDEVFNTFQITVASDVKSRIVNAEILYQNNQRDGVEEIEVVEVVNGLKIKFDAPEFGKTDLYEVRKIRQSLQLFAPQLVGHGRASEVNFVNNVQPTIVAKMSPTEAVFVTMTLVYQKISNPEYQQTFAERDAGWAAAHSLKSMQPMESDPVRVDQINNSIKTKINSMSISEQTDLPHKALNILGIEQ